MSSFKIGVENQVESILRDYVGVSGIYSDPNSIYIVNAFDRRIPDLDIENRSNIPLVAIMARQTTQWQRPRGEIGTSREIWDWTIDIYYLDVSTTDFNSGYDRQDGITNTIKNALENEPKLRGLSIVVNPTSPTGALNEYVWNTDWTSIVWDNSGAVGDYYAFTAEMHLLVQTGRN